MRNLALWPVAGRGSGVIKDRIKRMSSSGSSKTRMERPISGKSEGLAGEFVLRLVWGAGALKDFDNEAKAERCFLPRPYTTSLAKNFEAFLR